MEHLKKIIKKIKNYIIELYLEDCWLYCMSLMDIKLYKKIIILKISTPTKFYFDGNFINDRDAGQILEFFISDNPNNINSIKTIDADVNPLLDYKLYLDNFDEFWNIFDKIFDNLDNDSDFELSDDYSEKEKDFISSINKIYKLYYSSINFKYDKRKTFKYQKINQKNRRNNLRFKI